MHAIGSARATIPNVREARPAVNSSAETWRSSWVLSIVKGWDMRIWPWAFLGLIFLSAGCGSGHVVSTESGHVSAARAVDVDREVRAFAQAVTRAVSHEGPAAWRRYFAEGPQFFMASEGRLVFPNSTSVTAAMPELVRTFKQIELQWGDDLRVDPLAPDLAMMAASYHEIQVNATGSRVDESGYFTGIAEYRGDRWQFRDAHWSVLPPAK
jgi:hypothetical protein